MKGSKGMQLRAAVRKEAGGFRRQLFRPQLRLFAPALLHKCSMLPLGIADEDGLDGREPAASARQLAPRPRDVHPSITLAVQKALRVRSAHDCALCD
jgi:hypothetical protein